MRRTRKKKCGPRLRTRSKKFSVTQEAMLSCLDTGQHNPAACRLTSQKIPREVLATVLNEEIGKLMEHFHFISNPKYGKETKSLTQGLPVQVEGTNTIFFIYKNQVPANRWRDITHGHIMVSYRPKKDNPKRTRLMVGGNIMNYPGDCGTTTADLLTLKLYLNSAIFTIKKRYRTINIKDSYLNTPIAHYKDANPRLADLPDNAIKYYNSELKVTADG